MDLVNLIENNLIQSFVPDRTLTLIHVSRGVRNAMYKYTLNLRMSEIVQSVKFVKSAIVLKIPEKKIYHHIICYGDMKIIKYLHNRGIDTKELITRAAMCGNLDIIKWVFKIGEPLTAEACVAAAEKNQIHVLKWLRLKKCPLDSRVIVHVARSGDASTFKWLLDKQCPWNDNAYVVAAELGRSDIIKMAWRRKIRMSDSIAIFAYRSGHLKLAKWLYYNCGQTILKDFHEYALKMRDYKMVQWALNQGISFTAFLPELVAEHLDESDLEWILEAHPFVNAEAVYEILIKRGDLNLLRTAVRAGLQWSSNLTPEVTDLIRSLR